MSKEPYYTIKTLAAELSLSESTVRRMVRRGQIGYYKMGSNIRFSPDDVKLYLASVQCLTTKGES